MKILYGIVGEGMGHATRSRVSLEHLLTAGHEIRVVVSGRAHQFLTDRFAGHSNILFHEIHGLHLDYEGNAVDKSASFWSNLEQAPKGVLKNIAVYREVAEDGFRPDVVISDFESWAYLYGIAHNIPVLSIDNMQVLNRAKHDEDVLASAGLAFRLAKMAVKIKLPGAAHYIVASFFFPEVRKDRTTLVPPILRPEILRAKRELGAHVIVYQTAASNEDLIPALQKLPYEFRLYGMGKDEQRGNVALRAFSEQGFIDDLRTARAVIAGGGFSLMGEAVHIGVPMFSVPLEQQFEQGLNARYLRKLGYGDFADTFDLEKMGAFLANSAQHEEALRSYLRQGNEKLYATLDGLLAKLG